MRLTFIVGAIAGVCILVLVMFMFGIYFGRRRRVPSASNTTEMVDLVPAVAVPMVEADAYAGVAVADPHFTSKAPVSAGMAVAETPFRSKTSVSI